MYPMYNYCHHPTNPTHQATALPNSFIQPQPRIESNPPDPIPGNPAGFYNGGHQDPMMPVYQTYQTNGYPNPFIPPWIEITPPGPFDNYAGFYNGGHHDPMMPVYQTNSYQNPFIPPWIEIAPPGPPGNPAGFYNRGHQDPRMPVYQTNSYPNPFIPPWLQITPPGPSANPVTSYKIGRTKRMKLEMVPGPETNVTLQTQSPKLPLNVDPRSIEQPRSVADQTKSPQDQWHNIQPKPAPGNPRQVQSSSMMMNSNGGAATNWWERPDFCIECSVEFKDTYSFKMHHFQVHSGESTFTGRIPCDMTSGPSSSLKRHLTSYDQVASVAGTSGKRVKKQMLGISSPEPKQD